MEVSEATIQNEIDAIETVKMLNFKMDSLISELDKILDSLENLTINWNTSVSKVNIEDIKALVPNSTYFTVVQGWIDSIVSDPVIAYKIEKNETLYM